MQPCSKDCWGRRPYLPLLPPSCLLLEPSSGCTQKSVSKAATKPQPARLSLWGHREREGGLDWGKENAVEINQQKWVARDYPKNVCPRLRNCSLHSLRGSSKNLQNVFLERASIWRIAKIIATEQLKLKRKKISFCSLPLISEAHCSKEEEEEERKNYIKEKGAMLPPHPWPGLRKSLALMWDSNFGWDWTGLLSAWKWVIFIEMGLVLVIKNAWGAEVSWLAEMSRGREGRCERTYLKAKMGGRSNHFLFVPHWFRLFNKTVLNNNSNLSFSIDMYCLTNIHTYSMGQGFYKVCNIHLQRI